MITGSVLVGSARAQILEGQWSRQNRPFEELQRERRFLFSRRMGDVCFGMTDAVMTTGFFSVCRIWKYSLSICPATRDGDFGSVCRVFLSKVSISQLVIMQYPLARDLETVK